MSPARPRRAHSHAPGTAVSFTVLSSLPLASQPPSGPNATQKTV